MRARSSSIRAVVSAGLQFVPTLATHVYSATRLLGMVLSTQSGNIGVFILINNHLGESYLQTKRMLLTDKRSVAPRQLYIRDGQEIQAQILSLSLKFPRYWPIPELRGTKSHRVSLALELKPPWQQKVVLQFSNLLPSSPPISKGHS